MLTGYHKNKYRLSRKACQGTKIFVKDKNTESPKMLVSNIKLFMKKKKGTINMAVNNIKSFRRMKS